MENKKLIKFTLVIILVIGLLTSIIMKVNSQKKTETKQYKVAGITKSPLYLPVFVGIAKDYFENLEVEYVNTTGGDIANTMLLSDEVDAVLNSLNIVMNSIGDINQIIAIGELTHRGGMTLVSKVNFNEIETIVSAKNGGLPNTILENTTDYKIVAKLSPQEGVTYFLNQNVDAIMAFEPFATQLKKQGYKTKSMNEYYNDIPFNCILIKKTNLKDSRNKNFMQGLLKSLKYIENTESNIIAKEVKELMDYDNEELLASIIDTFKNDNVWNNSLELNKNEYEYYLEFTNLKKEKFKDVYQKVTD